MIVSWDALVLDEAIRERHSTRMFLPQSVPRALVDESLAPAEHAPSNSNIQPSHIVLASGPPRDRVVAALLNAARRGPPNFVRDRGQILWRPGRGAFARAVG